VSAADLDPEKVAAFLRATIRANAARLALDPASITSTTPRSVAARTTNGSLLRVDFSTYAATELTQ
jgi:hypothetical protein